jgi:hypothetical protein
MGGMGRPGNFFLAWWTALAQALLVNASSQRRIVNPKTVNKSAPELFPVMSLVKKEFTGREREERRAFDRPGMICYNSLKMLVLLW